MKEHEYLRNELNSRIMLTYTHSHTTMTFVITVWSVLITFVCSFFLNYYKTIYIFAPFIILVTLCYIFFASQKYRENLDQIIKISSYYACFYNYVGAPNETCDAWELITMDMKDDKEYALNPQRKVLPRMNGEYTFFATFALLINLVLLIVFIVFHLDEVSMSYVVIYAIEQLLIDSISIFLIIKISNNTTLKHYHEEHMHMFAIWLKYAIGHGYITKEDVENKYNNLNEELWDKIRSI